MPDRDAGGGEREMDEAARLRRVAWALSAKVTSQRDGGVAAFSAFALAAIVLFFARSIRAMPPRDIFWLFLALLTLVRALPHVLSYRAQVRLLRVLEWDDRVAVDASPPPSPPPATVAAHFAAARQSLSRARIFDRRIGKMATASICASFVVELALDLVRCGTNKWP